MAVARKKAADSDAAAAKIALPDLKIGKMQLHCIGDAPLVTHKFSEKAKKMMLDVQTKQAKIGREAKVPTLDFLGALHQIPGTQHHLHEEDPENVWAEGEFGVRACGFKAALIRAGKICGHTMTDLRTMLRVPGESFDDAYGSEALIRIFCAEGARMRMDMVRLATGVADIRFRPEFRKWEIFPEVWYNTATLSKDQVLNLVRYAGFGVGLCEWRPEKGGEWGTWRVDMSEVRVQEVLW